MSEHDIDVITLEDGELPPDENELDHTDSFASDSADPLQQGAPIELANCQKDALQELQAYDDDMPSSVDMQAAEDQRPTRHPVLTCDQLRYHSNEDNVEVARSTRENQHRMNTNKLAPRDYLKIAKKKQKQEKPDFGEMLLGADIVKNSKDPKYTFILTSKFKKAGPSKKMQAFERLLPSIADLMAHPSASKFVQSVLKLMCPNEENARLVLSEIRPSCLYLAKHPDGSKSLAGFIEFDTVNLHLLAREFKGEVMNVSSSNDGCEFLRKLVDRAADSSTSYMADEITEDNDEFASLCCTEGGSRLVEKIMDKHGDPKRIIEAFVTPFVYCTLAMHDTARKLAKKLTKKAYRREKEMINELAKRLCDKSARADESLQTMVSTRQGREMAEHLREYVKDKEIRKRMKRIIREGREAFDSQSSSSSSSSGSESEREEGDREDDDVIILPPEDCDDDE